MTTTDQLQERLKATPWRHTYSGIPIWDGPRDEFVTIGRADKTAFVDACDAYYRDMCGESLAEAGLGDRKALIRDVQYRKTRINVDEFPHGEFGVSFGEGDVDVTVLASL